MLAFRFRKCVAIERSLPSTKPRGQCSLVESGERITRRRARGRRSLARDVVCSGSSMQIKDDQMGEFRGFSPSFFAFFKDLKANNERAWFEAHKERFRGTVQTQMSLFIAAMAPELKTISKEFIADPRPN